MPARNWSVRRQMLGRGQAQRGEFAFTIQRPLSHAPRLVGSLCSACGAYSFPRQASCSYCGCEEVQEVALSRKGRLETFAIIRHARADYAGPLPYAVGTITLPEGIRICALLQGCQPEDLRIGIEVELDLIKIWEDRTGNNALTQAFRPVESKKLSAISYQPSV